MPGPEVRAPVAAPRSALRSNIAVVLRYAWIALAMIGCKYPDPGSAGDGGIDIDAVIDADLVNGAYVVAHTSLDGATTKVAVVRTLDVFGDVDLSGARTFGAGTRVFMANGYVFVATDLTVRRFSVVDYGLVEDGTPINFVPTGVTSFSDAFYVLDPTHAWYFDRARFEAYALDLDTMSTSTAIFYSPLNFTDNEVYVTGAYASVNADVVYVPYHFRRASDPLFVESEMYIAQFSLSGQSLTTMTSATSLRSARCSRSRPFARLVDDTLLFLGDIGSLQDLGPQPQDPNCVVRVTPAAPNEIDFNFYLNMDTQTSPEMSATEPVQAGNQVYTWARDMSHYTTQAEWDASSTWSPQLSVIAADGESMTTEKVTSAVRSIGAPGRTFMIDGRPYFLVPNTSGTGTSLFAEKNATFSEHARFPGTVTWIERVR